MGVSPRKGAVEKKGGLRLTWSLDACAYPAEDIIACIYRVRVRMSYYADFKCVQFATVNKIHQL
jgi:hypothetical protein